MITRKVMDEIKQGHKCSLSTTLTPDIEARVFLAPTKTGKIKVRAYLMSRNPKARLHNVREKTKTVKTLSELEPDCRAMCNALLAAYHAAIMPAPVVRNRTAKTFAAQVLAVPDITNPDNYAPYVKRGWGKTTAVAAVNYYANTIGKVYNQYGYDASESDFRAFLEDEISRIYNGSYKQTCVDEAIVSQRRENIYNGIMSRWQQALAVQRYLLDHHPEGDWPTTIIPVEARYKTAKAEELKAITYEQYIKLCTILVRLCEAAVAEAYAAALEATCAARIGESCAPRIGEIELYDTYGRYYINTQVDDRGGRTTTLKRESSRRYVVFGGLFAELVRLRIVQLQAKGYSDEEIADMPFGANVQTPNSFPISTRISAFLRELLALVGCDEDWLEQEAERLFISEKVHGTAEDLDVGAHLLRRTLTTFWANGGVPIGYVDAQLGHASKANKGIDFGSHDTARAMAAMIERSLYLGSLCSTDNPAYTAVQVGDAAAYKLMGNTQYMFATEKDMWMEIDINALEPGRDVQIVSTSRMGISHLMARHPVDTIESRCARSILPLLPTREEVEKWIDDAKNIDLSGIIKKYQKEGNHDYDGNREEDPE